MFFSEDPIIPNSTKLPTNPYFPAVFFIIPLYKRINSRPLIKSNDEQLME